MIRSLYPYTDIKWSADGFQQFDPPASQIVDALYNIMRPRGMVAIDKPRKRVIIQMPDVIKLLRKCGFACSGLAHDQYH